MTRTEFTLNLAILIKQMVEEGEHPILDFVKRSDAEQQRLFNAGLSKCDGINNISKHQTGRAADILFVEDGKMVYPKLGYDHWHEVWEALGGSQLFRGILGIGKARGYCCLTIPCPRYPNIPAAIVFTVALSHIATE